MSKHQKRRGALDLFRTIPSGTTSDEAARFEDYSLDSLYVPIYDLHGNKLRLRGPVHVVDKSRGNERRKVRLVMVHFYHHDPQQAYALREYARSYAWQGDNQNIHLLEQLDLLDEDPITVSQNEPDILDDLDVEHSLYVRNSHGEEEAFEAIA